MRYRHRMPLLAGVVLLLGLFPLLFFSTGVTAQVIEVRTEGSGTIEDQIFGVTNLNGTMVWSESRWLVTPTWAHRYFFDTRTGQRQKAFETTILEGSEEGIRYDQLGIRVTARRTAYTAPPAPGAGVNGFAYDALDFEIRQASGRRILLRSRGTGNETAQVCFDIYIEHDDGSGTTALRGDPVWFEYDDDLEEAVRWGDPARNRRGQLPTPGGDYFLDVGAGADMGPVGIGKSYQFLTAVWDPSTVRTRHLGSAFPVEFRYKWMEIDGTLHEIRVTPVILSESPAPPFGDVDHSQLVNGIDLSLLADYLAENLSIIDPTAADVHSHQGLNAADLAVFRAFLAGAIPFMPFP